MDFDIGILSKAIYDDLCASRHAQNLEQLKFLIYSSFQLLHAVCSFADIVCYVTGIK